MDSEGDMDLTDVEFIVEPSSRASSVSRSIRRRSDDSDIGSPTSSKRARIDITSDQKDGSHSGLTNVFATSPERSSSQIASTSSSSPIMGFSQPSSVHAVEDLAESPTPVMKPARVDIPQRQYSKDLTYYMEDGSCILLVEDTLFNVHRTMLSKDSSSFSAMFLLPQVQESEGRSDNNPIVLHGDSPAEFRDFLWALYALPPELSIVHSPSADLNQLINIARVSNKYSFKSLETWALDAIHEYVNRKPSPILKAIPHPMAYTFTPHLSVHRWSQEENTGIESTVQLTRLIRLAQMCAHEKLLSTMIGLLKQLMGSSLQYAYLAMSLADELNLRALKGPAYLEVMHKAMLVNKIHVELPVKSKTSSLTAASTGHGNQHHAAIDEDIEEGESHLIVNPAQQLRLLSGYYRLARTWESLRLTPPHFDHAPSCGATWHQNSCTQSWQEFWKEKTRGDTVLSYGLADVLGRLRQVQKEYDRWGSATYMHHDCRMAARKSIQEVIRAVEDALPDSIVFELTPGSVFLPCPPLIDTWKWREIHDKDKCKNHNKEDKTTQGDKLLKRNESIPPPRMFEL